MSNLIVVVDDIALPLGSIRIRPKGGDGGHNGLEHINRILGSGNYARLRFGIGDNFTGKDSRSTMYLVNGHPKNHHL